MSVNLSIKGVSDLVAERLRQRAERNHRSLQGELTAIIEQAVLDPQTDGQAASLAQSSAARAAPPATRTLRHGWKTIGDLLAERHATARPATPAGTLPLAVDIIRADRDSR